MMYPIILRLPRAASSDGNHISKRIRR